MKTIQKCKIKAVIIFIALIASTSVTFGAYRPESAPGCDKLFQNGLGKINITIFPTIVRSFSWTIYDQSSSKRIGTFFETNNLAKVQYSNKKIDMSKSMSGIQWNLFKKSMSLFADYLKEHPIDTEYALVVEYLVSPRRIVSPRRSGGEAVGGIQCYVLDSSGSNAFSFLLNSHHELFIDAQLKTDNATAESRDELVKKSTEVVIKAFQCQLNLDDKKNSKK